MKARLNIVLLLGSFTLGCLYAKAQTISGIVNSYYQVISINTTNNSVTVDNVSGLSAGGRVLILQAKGAAITETNTSAFGDITALNGAGNYEFNTICSISGNEVVMRGPFLNSYEASGLVQLVSVPSYGSSVTISGTVTASPWDPLTGKGGIVVIEAAGSIQLNADIDVSGLGFLGGALVNYPTPTWDCSAATTVNNYFLPLPVSGDYTGGKKGEGITPYITGKEYAMGKLANGGGGGNNANSGGAGGGNYGAGGAGGQRAGEAFYLCHAAYPGIGGLSLSSYGYSTASGRNRIFFGGGGGSGHENNGVGEPGANGGGIIILSAPAINGGGGNLLANGLRPLNPACLDPYQAEGDGGGGGGAGGSIILNSSSISGTINASASGGRGSDASNRVNDCTGPGGGGGGGIVWTAGPAFPAAITATVSGGANGVVSAGNTKTACRGLSNGAASGASGSTTFNYSAPESTGNTCIPLASDDLLYFKGRPITQGYSLSWAFHFSQNTNPAIACSIQRSIDRIHFNTLALFSASNPAGYRYTDSSSASGAVFYRLCWTDPQYNLHYSGILAYTRPADPADLSIRIYPNPVSDLLNIQLFSPAASAASIQLFTAQGQPLGLFPLNLHSGANTLSLPVKSLPAASYFLVLESAGKRLVRSFIKR